MPLPPAPHRRRRGGVGGGGGGGSGCGGRRGGGGVARSCVGSARVKLAGFGAVWWEMRALQKEPLRPGGGRSRWGRPHSDQPPFPPAQPPLPPSGQSK